MGAVVPSEQAFAGLPLLTAIVDGSGMSHDLGKVTVFMQKKLVRALRLADPVRHEVVSMLLLPGFRHGATLDDAFAAPCVTLDDYTARRWIETADKGSGRQFPVDFPLPTMWRPNDVLTWLIGTHHRLPNSGPGTDHHLCPTAKGKPWKEAELKANAAFKRDLLAGPFAAELRAKLAAVPEETLTPALRDALFLWGRLALILADHRASSIDLPPGDTGLVANSLPQPDFATERRLRQDLVQHLRAVAQSGVEIASLLTTLDTHLPTLSTSVCAKLRSDTDHPDFQWQNVAAAAAHALASEPDAGRRGAFVVVAAGTGSGKTRAAARLAVTLAGDRPVRLSTLLGLRSLTLQTGDAYRQQLCLPAADTAVLIGSREIRALHEATHNTNNEPDTDPNDAPDEIRPSVAGVGLTDIPAALQGECRHLDERRLLASPVAVCTIDYLMSGADWRRCAHVLAQLRLASSDLILDEVDGYDLRDYPALARLCYLAGVFGRRLIFTSATAMPELMAPLYDAYATGRQAYAALSGNEPVVDVLLAADIMPAEIHRGISSAAFVDAYSTFCGGLAIESQARAIARPLRRGRVAEVRSLADVCRETMLLHVDNATTLEGGVRLSVGMLRFARVRDAAWVALKLAAANAGADPSQTVVKVLPYHSYLPLAVRHRTEELLDEALLRKGSTDPVGCSRLCQPALHEARARGVKDVLIIVVATPVEEVGRDHDYDYALIEPSSSRSIVQCAGRVNRHRRQVLPDGQYNIAVMRWNCRELEAMKTKRQRSVFHSPGFEPKGNKAAFAIHDIVEIAAATVALPTALPCLGPRSETAIGKLALWEREEVAAFLRENVSRQFVNDEMGKLTTKHMSVHRFRSSDVTGDSPVFYDREEQTWRKVDAKTGKAVQQRFSCWPRAASTCWVLPPESFDEINAVLMTRLAVANDSDYDQRYLTATMPGYMAKNPEDTFADPMLGLFNKHPSVLTT